MFGRTISLKAHLDNWDDLATRARVLLDAYLDLLAALEAAGAAAPGEAGSRFRQDMSALNAQLAGEPTPAAIQQASQGTRQAIQAWATAVGDRELDYKHIIQTLAEVSASIAATGTSAGQEMMRIATQLDAASRAESLAQARQLLAAHVPELKGMAERVKAEAAARAAGLEKELQAVQARFRSAEAMAETDPLTGLGNRRKAELAVQSALQAGSPLSVLLLDLDQFKAVNDRYGHAQGDSLLKAVAQCIRQSARVNDVVCRWGGDEFLIVMPGARLAEAALVAERVRSEAFGQFVLGRAGENVQVVIGASIGVAEHVPNETPAELFERCDRMMYERKRAAKPAAGAPAR